MHCKTRVHTYERIIHTPGEAASLVAGGCGCEDEPRPGYSAFAIANPEAPPGAVTWSGVIGTEGELTGDGRLIEANALRWENLPIPIRYAPVDNGGHDGAQVVGRILTLERRGNGDIWGTGDFDPEGDIGREAIRHVGEMLTNGVSMDLDRVAFEIRIAKEVMDEINADMAEDPPQLEAVEPDTDEEGRVTVMEMGPDDEIMVTTEARVRAATIVAIPAFANATITLDEVSTPAGEQPAEDAPALVAAAAPMEPPAAWFDDPVLTGPTPITITKDGRIYGHLAVWGTCHTAYSGQCVEPPHSPSNYARFRLGATMTAEGREVPSGVITMDTLHAGRNLSAVDTLAHYEHTGKQAADVAAGEDIYGIWISGAVRPGLTDEAVRTLRAAPLSGDWRRQGGNLELVAALAVNTPGFPVPRAQGLVAGGAMHSLVASGVLDPVAVPSQPELPLDEDALADRIIVRMEQRNRLASAAKMASRVRNQRAAHLARRAGVR